MIQQSLKLCSRIITPPSSSNTTTTQRTLCWLSTTTNTTSTTTSTSTSIQQHDCIHCSRCTTTTTSSSLSSSLSSSKIRHFSQHANLNDNHNHSNVRNVPLPKTFVSSLSSSLSSSSSSFQQRMYSTTNIFLNQSKGTNDNDDDTITTNSTKESNTSKSTTTTTTAEITTPLSELSSQDLQLTFNSIQTTPPSSSQSSQSSIHLNLNNIPGTSTGIKPTNRQLAILYTCNICNTRSAKKFTEQAYNHGVVLVRCPNCHSLHLIADRLGYFSDDDELQDGSSSSSNSSSSDDTDDTDDTDENSNKKKGWDIEMFMKKIGQDNNIKVVTNGEEEDVLEVTLEDVIGKSSKGK